MRSFIDGVSFLLLIIISIYVPFMISFDVSTTGAFEYFEMFIDIWFLLEIIANFFTGFYNKGILIINLKLIIINYLKGWFLIDLCSSSPMIAIRILD
jgi:hypothetical protein